MATLKSDYQFFGRSSVMTSKSGSLSYYILLYGKTSANQNTGIHTVTIKEVLASTNDNATYYYYKQEHSGTINGKSAFLGTNKPSTAWNKTSITEGGITYKTWTLLGEGSVAVDATDGNAKDITLSCYYAFKDTADSYTPTNGTSRTVSVTATLAAIPREAKITAANDFTDQENPSFTFTNPGGFPMDVWLEPNPAGEHLCIRTNIENIGSYTWELTDAEREQLRNKCVGKNCTIRVGLYTYINGKQFLNYKDKTFYMTENDATKPNVTMTATLNNGSLPSQFDGMYIQGKSRLDVSISAQGKYSASITSYYADIGGERYNSNPFLSNVFNKDGTVEIIGYAKDSRQFTGSDKQEIEVIPYSKPLVIPLGSESAIYCYRSDGNGKRVGNSTSVWIKAKMSYYSVSSKNQCALQWRKKLVADEWDDGRHGWNDLIAKTDTTTNEYNALIPGVEFNLRESYSVQIRAIDDIGEYDVKNFEIPTQDVALHLGKGGKNVSIGTYCDYSKEYTFYSEWDAIFDKDVYVKGQKLEDFITTVINNN